MSRPVAKFALSAVATFAVTALTGCGVVYNPFNDPASYVGPGPSVQVQSSIIPARRPGPAAYPATHAERYWEYPWMMPTSCAGSQLVVIRAK